MTEQERAAQALIAPKKINDLVGGLQRRWEVAAALGCGQDIVQLFADAWFSANAAAFRIRDSRIKRVGCIITNSPDADVKRAADLAPEVMGAWIGDAVQIVLMDHSEDEYPDPNIHELAHRVIRAHDLTTPELAHIPTNWGAQIEAAVRNEDEDPYISVTHLIKSWMPD